ncbi:actin 6A [Pelobates cultripes]|uniref:Actin 6A n=1 Tax=Pelobates cultripes TaxID=61616 RepID=A0AAD1RCG3_PELCU|nr:actin 6A [Pelobates cultripes]
MSADEIKALVFDIGSCSMRAGYAGEDAPQVDIPTTIGVIADRKDGRTPNGDQSKYYIDASTLNEPKENVEAYSPFKDGMIEDWDGFQAILDYTYKMIIKSKPRLYPTVMSEVAWNAQDKREKLMELMFEHYEVPAFYLGKGPSFVAFANGRTTGLVLDSGSKYTAAVPVRDGYVLQKGIVKSPLAGDFITQQCRHYFKERNIDIIPPYMIASQESVREGEPAIWEQIAPLPQVTQSWHNYMCDGVIQDFKASVLQISKTKFHEKVAAKEPDVHYQFPNGYNCKFGTECLQIPEGLFDPSNVKGLSDNNMLSLTDVVIQSIELCDAGIKKALYSSVLVTGGNSLIEGYTERLRKDLFSKVAQEMNLKVFSKKPPVERKNNVWFGGSTFAALASFPQLCISKQEYEEGGRQCLAKKCP